VILDAAGPAVLSAADVSKELAGLRKAGSHAADADEDGRYTAGRRLPLRKHLTIFAGRQYRTTVWFIQFASNWKSPRSSARQLGDGELIFDGARLLLVALSGRQIANDGLRLMPA
jgi:hypothetical protein